MDSFIGGGNRSNWRKPPIVRRVRAAINVEVGLTFFYGEMLKGIHISKSSVLETATCCKTTQLVELFGLAKSEIESTVRHTSGELTILVPSKLINNNK